MLCRNSIISLGPQGDSLYVRDAGNDLLEILGDSLQHLRLVNLEPGDHSSNVASVTMKQFSGIGILEFLHGVGVQIVESHGSQGVIHRAENGVSRRKYEIKSIMGRRRRRDGMTDLYPSFLDQIISNGRTVGSLDDQALDLYRECAPFARCDLEIIVRDAIRKLQSHPQSQITRVSGALAPDLINSSPRVQRTSQRRLQAVGDKTKRIQKVALSRTVSSDKDGQFAKTDVAIADAFVVTNTHAADARRFDGWNQG